VVLAIITLMMALWATPIFRAYRDAAIAAMIFYCLDVLGSIVATLMAFMPSRSVAAWVCAKHCPSLFGFHCGIRCGGQDLV